MMEGLQNYCLDSHWISTLLSAKINLKSPTISKLRSSGSQWVEFFSQTIVLGRVKSCFKLSNQKLWRGEEVSFPGPGGDELPLVTYPRPIQKDLNVWLLVAQNDEAFIHAGRSGYNVFTMLYGIEFPQMERKIQLYRQARQEAGYPPETGIVTLMLHTLVHESADQVAAAVEKPFKEYIASSLKAHIASGHGSKNGVEAPSAEEEKKILDYAYERYYRNCAIFGTVEEASEIVEKAISIGVNDIACLMDFGVDYEIVKSSFNYLKQLVSKYR